MRELETLVLLAVAFYFDLRWRKIPNQWILVGWIGAVFTGWLSEGMEGVCSAICASVVVLVVGFLVFCIGGIGAGDIKILSVLSGLNGLECTGRVIVISSLFAGGGALVKMIHEKILFDRMRCVCRYILSLSYGLHAYGESDKSAGQNTIVLVPAILAAYMLVLAGEGGGIC